MRRWNPRNPACPSVWGRDIVTGRVDRIAPDVALAREYLANPFGEPSAALKRLLDVMRDEPPEGRLVAIETKPGASWTIARLTGRRGEAPVALSSYVHSSRAEAAAAIFRLRWKRMFGAEPAV